jgi:hypothetical protein
MVIKSGIWNAVAAGYTNSGTLNATAGRLRQHHTFNNVGTLTNSSAGIVNIAGGTIGAVTTVNAGTINVSGLSTINGAVTNSGTINLQNSAAADRLTIAGNFGMPGSTIALDFNSRTGLRRPGWEAQPVRPVWPSPA